MGDIHCKKPIWDYTRFHSRQCMRKAVKDGYCKQHHPDAVAKRREESDRKYEEKMKRDPLTLFLCCKKRCAELEAEVKRLRTWAANQKCKFPQANSPGGVCDKDCGDCIPCQARIALEGEK